MRLEKQACNLGAQAIAGIDEVGRGPWAGPVVAAAVILDPADVPPGLDDSKKLSPRRREALFDVLLRTSIWATGRASVGEVDDINVLNASHLAMIRALQSLTTAPDFLLIDGNRLPADLPCPAWPIVGGDGRSASIAAASIVAKVTRDRHMVDLAQQFPGYGWETNAGYGTQSHQSGLKTHGVTPHHRRSFKPIHNMLYQENY